MKKNLLRVISLLLVLILAVSLFCAPVFAEEEEDSADYYEYVVQATDKSYLTTKQMDALESKADRLQSKYKYVIEIVIVDDYYDYGCHDIEAFSEYAVKALGLGKKVVLLSISMDDRSYDIYVTDGASEAFESNAVGYYLEDAVVDCLKDNDWYGAGKVFQEKCETFLEAWKSGEPLAAPKVTPVRVLIVVGVSLLAALIVCSILKGQMKSARIQTNADNYLVSDSFNLSVCYDQYTHTTETRRKIEKQSSSGGGGGGGSHHSGHF